MCVRILVLCIYVSYSGAGGREGGDFLEAGEFGVNTCLIVCSVAQSVLAILWIIKAKVGLTSLNHFILMVNNMNMIRDSWVFL